MRKPFFIAALVLLAIAVAAELGAKLFTKPDVASPLGTIAQLSVTDPDVMLAFAKMSPEGRDDLLNQDRPPGLAIPALAMLDGLLLFTVIMIALDLFTNQKVPVAIQSGATAVFSLIILIVAILTALATFALILLMVSLFLAVPFGTLAYLAIYGFFNRGGANVTLGLVMAMKIAFVICLFLAQQRFIQNITLLLLIGTSFLGSILTSFLIGLPPIILVSIFDGISALVVAILASIWGLVILIPSIISLIKALKPQTVKATGTVSP
jgi:hypothetical protein